MEREPRAEGENARYRPALGPNFCNSGIAANHRHYAAIDVGEWLSRLSGDIGQNVIGAVSAGLLRDGRESRQRLSIVTRGVREIAQRVYTRTAGEREVRRDIDAATSTWLDTA